jgi:hypothetical protein
MVVGHDDLDDAFAWKEERTVSVNLTLTSLNVGDTLFEQPRALPIARKPNFQTFV